jgi:glycerophosphoryl diester phosphodiesterase
MITTIAHRGETRGNRENTLPAIQAAVDAGADIVEIDLRLTADSQLVVLHDPTLERLWSDPRAVAQVTFADLTEAHRQPTADWSIPTADQALDLIVALDSRFMLDVTSVPIGLATCAMVERRGLVDRVLYAGDTRALAAIRAAQPAAAIALSWERSTPPDEQVWAEVAPQYFNPEWVLVDEQVVESTHDAGRRVSTWTVDDQEQMTRLAWMGVDAIISNRIDVLVGVQQEGGSAA